MTPKDTVACIADEMESSALTGRTMPHDVIRWSRALRALAPTAQPAPDAKGFAALLSAYQGAASAWAVAKTPHVAKSLRREFLAIHEQLTSAYAALATAQSGWRMVPVEPTPEMLKAASDELGYCEQDRNDPETDLDHRTAYVAMLAAAPQPDNGGTP